MSRFKVTTHKWNADSEYCSREYSSTFDTYLIEAINLEDLEHECLGNYEAIWGGREALVKYIEECYGILPEEIKFLEG